MTENPPIILWFRRDFRLSDHAALSAACRTGRPVIPVFIHDQGVEELGAAPKWRLGLALEEFERSLNVKGSRLVCRRGDALGVLQALVAETGAGAVFWSRQYDPQSMARDTAVKAALKDSGVTAESFPGHVMFEPWTVETKTGGYYKVYTPFWRAVKERHVPSPLPAPEGFTAPQEWPQSEVIATWDMGGEMRRGAAVVQQHVAVGEQAALERLHEFVTDKVEYYKAERDFPGIDATSHLSENLTYGEISPATIWHAGHRAHHEGAKGGEHFLKELVWREFAWHLMYHTPHIAKESWREGWEHFPWSEDAEAPQVLAWKQGRTGVPFVDAAMRELYVTGTMHNRARMIVGSYLTKHLLVHWRIGQKWFEDCLVDWDPAANAMGWQWVAGSGPDASPYFRIFNPETQLDKFDADRKYTDAWIAEGRSDPSATALSYFDAVPVNWRLSPADPYPSPIVGLAEGRARALDAYANRGF
ncbi:cryptochrome/photolyase family protein [Actibacterium lipolyticum]|uniref:Deoxyribodipyrimidine photo-lyase n=1 Tax=Actibacterium lipolyticum TaxID=1524263 RepID=A0A238JWY3_9RHOB|nr:deoxyribodipyrimidine photo-lyase [Actibacterium lipolyticum]SMX34674.1 Deoxyribodipyrimidine photo-lyase [Actibacterium lipolyticum]